MSTTTRKFFEVFVTGIPEVNVSVVALAVIAVLVDG
jgi:hypothetical protein